MNYLSTIEIKEKMTDMFTTYSCSNSVLVNKNKKFFENKFLKTIDIFLD
jgi:hypothetical protein